MRLILLLGVSSVMELINASLNTSGQSSLQVLRYDTSNLPNSYKYSYETSDGSSRAEEGAFKPFSSKDPSPSLNVKGAVRWYDDKGHLFQMTYKAGRRGFRTIIKQLS